MSSGKGEGVGFSEWIDRPKSERKRRASKKKKPLAREAPLVGRHIELVEFLLANFRRKHIGYFLENEKGQLLGLLQLKHHDPDKAPGSEPDAFLKDADETVGRLYLVPGVRLVAERKSFGRKIQAPET